MKRVLAAALLALLAHGFFLAVPSGWVRKKVANVGEAETVTLTLAYYRPPKKRTVPKSPAPLKRKEKQKPVFKPKPKKKKVLIKPRAKKIPRPVVKKRATPSKVTIDNEGPSEETVEQVQETDIKDEPSLPDPGLSKNEPEETAPPADARVALKGPAQTPLQQAIPIYDKNPAPSYPRLARRRGYEGTTILEVLVNREGKVDAVRLSSSSGYSLLDRAAKSSVKKWVFIPAVKDNKKVEMWVKIPIRFQLR